MVSTRRPMCFGFMGPRYACLKAIAEKELQASENEPMCVSVAIQPTTTRSLVYEIIRDSGAGAKVPQELSEQPIRSLGCGVRVTRRTTIWLVVSSIRLTQVKFMQCQFEAQQVRSTETAID